MLIFGDGMHQTDDAVLYCLQPDTGLPLWRYPVPGKLVHLEAGPTIDKGRVYACGGDAGIFCLDAKRVILEGKEMDISAVAPIMNKRWAELLTEYEVEKKKDAQLAIPPSEDALPKATPKFLWKQGIGKWHIDAPPVVVGDFVIAASAYLADEKEGKSCVICLRASDGSIVWETPLKYNPWAGPTVAGQTVLVGCSSIRFDRKTLDKAQGEIVALDLATGALNGPQKPSRRPPPSSHRSRSKATSSSTQQPAAKSSPAASRTACASGPSRERTRISPESLSPAIPSTLRICSAALTRSTSSMAPSNGTSISRQSGYPIQEHGLRLARRSWRRFIFGHVQSRRRFRAEFLHRLPLRKSPRLQYQMAADFGRRGQALRQHSCRVAPRKLPALKEVYPLEVVATYPTPRGQKAHETVVTFNSKPSEIHKALESQGLKPGKPAVGEGVIGTGAEVKVSLEVPGITARPSHSARKN